MILIFSNSSYEPTTDTVIDWLIDRKADFFRLNANDLFSYNRKNFYSISGNQLIICDQVINIDEIKVVWYRRWYDYSEIPVKPKNRIERQLHHELVGEINSFLYFLQHLLSDKVWLCSPIANVMHNKLHVLQVAKQSGLDVPRAIVTNSKDEVIKFKKLCKQIISKPIGDQQIYLDSEGNGFKSYTQLLSDGLIKKLPDYFYLSLFQERIKAEFEIRTFYLDGEFYSTAIINSKTIDIKLSVRDSSQTFMSAFDLPESVKDKVRTTMKRINLNTGSMDILKTVDDKFFFLEVNPVGQFSGYAQVGNYQLEKAVADWLIKQDK